MNGGRDGCLQCPKHWGLPRQKMQSGREKLTSLQHGDLMHGDACMGPAKGAERGGQHHS